MIINCNNCNKNFNVNDDLIPKTGRLLECGKCNNRWFFKPINNNQNILYQNENNNNHEFETINDDINLTKKNNIKIENKKEIKKDNFKKYLINLLIFLISFVAIIIIFDTFKKPISIILPGLIPLLDNLYASFQDLKLFLKDLII